PDRNARGLPKYRTILIAAGVFGACLFYGDGMITPAVSILSAIEGLTVAAPSLNSVVVPIAVAVIVALFAVQRLGTGRVGFIFGPIMAVWFLTIAALGIKGICSHPDI